MMSQKSHRYGQPRENCSVTVVYRSSFSRSKRGVGGGYVLARDPADIPLSAIVSAVDGPIVAGDFAEPHTNGACDHEGQCVLLAVWADVGEHMRRYLEGLSLADIVTMARGDASWPGEPVT